MPRTDGLATRPAWPSQSSDWPDFGLIGEFMRTATGDTIRMEEFVEGDTLVIRAELPGVDPDKDVEVSMSGGVLHIAVTREDKFEHKGHGRVRTEFRYGSFSRSIALPAGTYESEVGATYADGILDVRIPIATTTPRKITVKH